MRAHSGNAEVQQWACHVLLCMISNAANKTRAQNAGAKAVAEAASEVHHGNEQVVKEARDLSEKLGYAC
jgi:hypothetical protein